MNQSHDACSVADARTPGMGPGVEPLPHNDALKYARKEAFSMKPLKVVLLWILSIVFVLLIVQNTAPVMAHFLWLTASVPVILLLIFAAAVGFISGLFIGLPMKRNRHDNA